MITSSALWLPDAKMCVSVVAYEQELRCYDVKFEDDGRIEKGIPEQLLRPLGGAAPGY